MYKLNCRVSSKSFFKIYQASYPLKAETSKEQFVFEHCLRSLR